MKKGKKPIVISCPACEGSVSSEAVACQHCVHTLRGGQTGGINMKDPVHFVGVVVASIFVVLFIASAIAGCIALMSEQ
jgi:hypothetical protein